MTKTGIYIVFFLTPFYALPQTKTRTDSLQKVLQAEISDQQKADVYNLLAKEYANIDSMKVIWYTSQSIRLAKKLNYLKGIVDAYYYRAWLMGRRGHYKRSVRLYEKGLKKAEKASYQEGIANIYNGLGITWWYQSNYTKAAGFYQKALDVRLKIGDQRGLSASYNNLGTIYHTQGNYPKALGFYQKSLKISQKIDSKKGIAGRYHNIGLIYYAQGNYSRALTFYHQSLKIKQKIGDKNGMAESFAEIGRVYHKQGDFSKAQSFYQRSLEAEKQNGHKKGVAEINLELGKLAMSQKKYAQAQVYLEKVKAQAEEKDLLAETWINLGVACYHQKKYFKSEQCLARGVRMAKASGNPVIVKEGAGFLAKVYQQLGDYKKAYENQLLFKEMADSLFNEENIRKLMRLEDKQRDDSLKLVQIKEKALLNASIQQQKLTQKATSIGLGLSIILVLTLWFFYKSKQRNNRMLEQKNQALHLANDEIQMINTTLQQILDTIKKQHKDIVDSIGYAQRIQQAMLPFDSRMQAAFSEYFILFRPRDIVSGDFYWFEEIDGKKIIVAADCTGHGVPGAFMTMLGTQALTDIIVQRKIHRSDEILNQLDEMLQQLLQSKDTHLRDGMDAVVCVVDQAAQKVQFSGAQNPLILVQNGTLKEVKGDVYSINGYHQEMQSVYFTAHTLDISQPTAIYLYSDGYLDQFGGRQGEKFKKQRFLPLLQKITGEPMKEQRQILETTLTNWMGSYEQIDDILVMGVRV